MLVNQTTVGTVCHHFDSCLQCCLEQVADNTSSNASCARSQTIMCATGLILAVVLIVEVWNVGEYRMCIDTPLYCTCCFWLRGARNRVPRSHQYVMSSVPCYLGHFGPTNISVVVDVVTWVKFACCLYLYSNFASVVQQESLTRVLVWMLSEITSLIVLVLLLVICVRLACPGNLAKIMLLHTTIRWEFKKNPKKKSRRIINRNYNCKLISAENEWPWLKNHEHSLWFSVSL